MKLSLPHVFVNRTCLTLKGGVLMNKLLITFCALLVLFTGCKSEIDKCANALMANDKDMDEGMARLTCLQVQNGHKE